MIDRMGRRQPADRHRADRAGVAGARHGPAGDGGLHRAGDAVGAGPLRHDRRRRADRRDRRAAPCPRRPRRSSCWPPRMPLRSSAAPCPRPRPRRSSRGAARLRGARCCEQALDAGAATTALLSAHMIIFWLQPGFQRHPAGLPRRLRRRGHRQAPRRWPPASPAGRSPRASTSCRCSPTRRSSPATAGRLASSPSAPPASTR